MTPAQQRAAAADAHEVQVSRANRRVRKRTDLMLRAQAAVWLAVDGLTVRERAVILNEILTETLHDLRQQAPSR